VTRCQPTRLALCSSCRGCNHPPMPVTRTGLLGRCTTRQYAYIAWGQSRTPSPAHGCDGASHDREPSQHTAPLWTPRQPIPPRLCGQARRMAEDGLAVHTRQVALRSRDVLRLWRAMSASAWAPHGCHWPASRRRSACGMGVRCPGHPCRGAHGTLMCVNLKSMEKMTFCLYHTPE
jgi:hypothetical protein